ncbi:MAG: hypothetical protein GXY83_09665 [Rhodopirellula sp.]|nr:hypothetical protein [Rhodopirellula sp.]
MTEKVVGCLVKGRGWTVGLTQQEAPGKISPEPLDGGFAVPKKKAAKKKAAKKVAKKKVAKKKVAKKKGTKKVAKKKAAKKKTTKKKAAAAATA